MRSGTSKSVSTLFLSGIFLLVQSFALVHVTQNGGESHEHDGAACLIVGYTDRDDVVDTPEFVVLPITVIPHEILAAKAQHLADKALPSIQPARAPPAV